MTVALLATALAAMAVWVRNLTAEAAALRERLKTLETDLRRAQLAAAENRRHTEPSEVVETLNQGAF